VWEIASGTVTALISRPGANTWTANMSGTLEEFDEGVYHVGSWCFIFLTVNTRCKRVHCDRGHN
jgi:hypothetical protein